ncbi:rhodanese-like domain-containing protein [Desulfobotulus sp.]|jgi:rhodanese-related sulfurtransferase|uniref:rhodanese-like domain-containing protein n=1 Tax=Desulfobotulus sp. TaxID=1940337 RepID=UPI002A36D458|nr:rhodanese-like domain-containing protein [Desulfobotulus sp.]MDY0163590.1 rhodanese-like domain-containing protein [Desulfobotulus sp.]
MKLQEILQKSLWQIPLILAISTFLALGINLLRKDGLPLFKTPEALLEASGETLSMEEAIHLFRKNQAVFVDARDKRDYDQGRIAGARLLAYDDFDNHIADFFEEVAPETSLVVYCDGRHCDLSHGVARLLREFGYERVKVLVNGWSLWQEAGLPVERGGKG